MCCFRFIVKEWLHYYQGHKTTSSTKGLLIKSTCTLISFSAEKWEGYERMVLVNSYIGKLNSLNSEEPYIHWFLFKGKTNTLYAVSVE